MITPELNEALSGLLQKYAVEPARPWQLGDGGEPSRVRLDAPMQLLPGSNCEEEDLPDHVVPLFPWRYERRFQELRNLVQSETITPVRMCRFACLVNSATRPLDALLYREFDLAEWLGGSPIASVYASIDGELAANAIVRLEGGVLCSVEVATTLPPGSATHDRHEIIAGRGVASDRVVDTQVPQSSVYVWNDQGAACFTDTDAELAGLDAESAALVRAAYDAVQRPESHSELRDRHVRLRQLVALARQSDRQQQRLDVPGRLS